MCCCDAASRAGEFPLEGSCASPELPSFELTLPVPLSIDAAARCTPFDARRFDRNVHVRFLDSHREHGNFLSHFVFVFAHMVQAIGVRPADLGVMP